MSRNLHTNIFMCKKIHLKTLDGESSAFQLSQSSKCCICLSCHCTAESRVWEKCYYTRSQVKEKVFRGLEARAASQRARGIGAWESGEVWILMCRNNVVLDTPKHHGTQAKQQNHLHSVWKLVRKSYKNINAHNRYRNTTISLINVTIFITPKCN